MLKFEILYKNYTENANFLDEFKLKVSYCDGVLSQIYLDHKFQWPHEGLNSASLVYEVVT